MTKLRTAALSDIGHLRMQNEDRFMRDDDLGLYGVADGVGGLPGGEEAAQLAVDHITRAVQQLGQNGKVDLKAAVHAANKAVIERGQQLSPNVGIGTTLTFGVVRDGKMHLAHVGDSRCYLWNSGSIKLLTRDHSVESDANFRRARGEVVHYHQVNRNALTRCVGQPSPPDPDVIILPLEAGDRFIFCSDGVTRLIRDIELGEIIGRGSDADEVAREIVGLANQRGGLDNSTVVLVFVDAEK